MAKVRVKTARKAKEVEHAAEAPRDVVVVDSDRAGLGRGQLVAGAAASAVMLERVHVWKCSCWSCDSTRQPVPPEVLAKREAEKQARYVPMPDDVKETLRERAKAMKKAPVSEAVQVERDRVLTEKWGPMRPVAKVLKADATKTCSRVVFDCGHEATIMKTQTKQARCMLCRPSRLAKQKAQHIAMMPRSHKAKTPEVKKDELEAYYTRLDAHLDKKKAAKVDTTKKKKGATKA